MAGQLVHRLKTELDRAEADAGSSLADGRVELPECEHRLTVVLGIEGHCGAKRPGSSSMSDPWSMTSRSQGTISR